MTEAMLKELIAALRQSCFERYTSWPVQALYRCTRCHIRLKDVNAPHEPFCLITKAEKALQVEGQLLQAARWAEFYLKQLVTEDEGSGSFVRGTGTELAGFSLGMDALRKAIRDSMLTG